MKGRNADHAQCDSRRPYRAVCTAAVPERRTVAGMARRRAGGHRRSTSDTRLSPFAHSGSAAERPARRLPAKSARNAAESSRRAGDPAGARATSRERFLARACARGLRPADRDRMARFVRLEELVFAAADACARPGADAGADRGRKGTRCSATRTASRSIRAFYLAHVLLRERTGLHLCHAMLLPRPEAADALAKLRTDGVLDLGAVALERHGQGHPSDHVQSALPQRRGRDDARRRWRSRSTSRSSIRRPTSRCCAAAPVEHPKYRGPPRLRRGINLTHLYRGKIPFVWFLQRDWASSTSSCAASRSPTSLPDDVHGRGIEKPWIAAVDGFAIGGHCQILLAWTMCSRRRCLSDAAGAQGRHHPGPRQSAAAALHRRPHRPPGDPVRAQARVRQPRRQADLRRDRAGRRDGRGDRARRRRPHQRRARSAPSAIAAPSASREEPLDLFRRYCAVYAREQAYCHFSPALIANLERNWDAQNRAE